MDRMAVLPCSASLRARAMLRPISRASQQFCGRHEPPIKSRASRDRACALAHQPSQIVASWPVASADGPTGVSPLVHPSLRFPRRNHHALDR